MTKKLTGNIKSFAIITFGLGVFALAWTAFLIPHRITGSGVSGIGALVYYATGIPVGYTFLAVNLILLGLALKILGANFGVKTVYGVIVASTLLSILQSYINVPVVEDKFLSTIIGGGLGGLGLGIIFTEGGSTGGTDIIAMIINKYRNISPGRVILLCDIFIIGSSFLVLTDLEPVKRIETIVYGYVAMALQAYAIDTFLSGNKQSVQFIIFSKKYEEISDKITMGIGRGATVVDGTGWYSKEKQKVIITIVRKHEASNIYRMIKEIDNNAFISVSNVMGVYGKGFEQIRH
ncbi:YitT family protein [Tenuifilum thalassicum]|uniref:YitT family protein n=1 Tax=Tenuifilum thalassicum TaxID=2590900 RepID=A0A7D4BKL4_9BACT|nr:YitT family protein [Tenuifilum thalassicum]QKG80259.1 YitT family protein [Tenuifilum thalassicum]